jgi:hypothetical protein
MRDVPTYEKIADIFAIYGRGRESFRPPTYVTGLISKMQHTFKCQYNISVT